jgi:uncharacterized protein
LFKTLLIGFIFINIIAIFHAYKFTHTKSNTLQARTDNPEELNLIDKGKAILLGIDNPKPINIIKPKNNYTTILINGNPNLEAWYIPIKNSKGTVIIFHGYVGKKSDFLRQADFFRSVGYSTFLVDFSGSGGSSGNLTTIGYYEAEQVKRAIDYIQTLNKENIILYGHSMGAAAILKAINDYNLPIHKIILECPFSSMYQTVCNRFNSMNIPSFPMAHLLIFWGGIINNFWAYNNNPSEFAKKVKCSTLLLYGLEDKRVNLFETNEIFKNLSGEKTLKIYPNVGHNDFLETNYQTWANDIESFLNI